MIPRFCDIQTGCTRTFRGRDPEKITTEEATFVATEIAHRIEAAGLDDPKDQEIAEILRDLKACGSAETFNRHILHRLYDWADARHIRLGPVAS